MSLSSPSSSSLASISSKLSSSSSSLSLLRKKQHFPLLKVISPLYLLSPPLLLSLLLLLLNYNPTQLFCEARRNFKHTSSEIELTDQVSLSPSTGCAPGETPIFVHNAALVSGKYFVRRQVIRRTWGEEAKNNRMRLFFVIGLPEDYDTVQPVLREELASYQDLLQFNFLDNYWNITLKAIGELKWAAQHCNTSAYMVKVDDDVVVNVPMLAELVQKRSLPSGITGLQHHILAHREPDHKWYMPPRVYHHENYEFLMGFGYVLSMDRLKQMLTALTTYPGLVVDIDDVFLTGLIADHGGVERHNSFRFRFLCSLDVCAMERSLMTHGCSDPKSSEQLYRLWKQNIVTPADRMRCQEMPLIRNRISVGGGDFGTSTTQSNVNRSSRSNNSNRTFYRIKSRIRRSLSDTIVAYDSNDMLDFLVFY